MDKERESNGETEICEYVVKSEMDSRLCMLQEIKA